MRVRTPSGAPDIRQSHQDQRKFESEAQGVRNYESLFLPGLLQTEDYARAVIRGVLPAATDEQVEDRIRARMERQPLLTKESPLKFWAVVDEAALRRVVGGPAVMRAQLQQLADVVTAPNVTLQVIPFGTSAHPGMPGQFILLDFADPMDTDLIYIDSMAGDLFLESEADISRYRSIFENLMAVALSPSGSASLITELATELKEKGGWAPHEQPGTRRRPVAQEFALQW